MPIIGPVIDTSPAISAAITAPSAGANLTQGTAVLITGTITIAGTVNVFNGAALLGAATIVGLTWSYSWTPLVGDIGARTINATATATVGGATGNAPGVAVIVVATTPQFFDSGPVGTWALAAAFPGGGDGAGGPAPVYWRDSFHKLRLQAVSANPTLTITVRHQNSGLALVQCYVNGVFQGYGSVPRNPGDPDVNYIITKAVVCGAGDMIELRAGERTVIISATPGIYLPAPPTPAKRLIVLADSIGAGFQASAGQEWTTLLADDPPGPSWRITNCSFTGNYLAGYGSVATSATLAAALLARCDGTVKNVIFIALGINDFGTLVPAATTQTNYLAMVTGIRLAIPSCGICAFTPLIYQNNDTLLNSIGESVPQTRSAITNAMTGISDSIVIDGLPVMTNANQNDARVHPNNAGMLLYKNAVRPALLAKWGA